MTVTPWSYSGDVADKSAIEWTEATWNPTTGCDRTSPGCDRCYALTLSKRLKAMGSPKYQNEVAVKKFKDGLWEVDGVSGQRFRDPRYPNQMSFDILSPDITPLENRFLELLDERDYNMAEFRKYALLETIYKETHVKDAVDRLIERRRVNQVRTGHSFEDRVFSLAEPQLF